MRPGARCLHRHAGVTVSLHSRDAHVRVLAHTHTHTHTHAHGTDEIASADLQTQHNHTPGGAGPARGCPPV